MEKELKKIKKELAKQKQRVFDLEIKVNGIIETIEVVHTLVKNAIKIMLEKYPELEKEEK